MRFPFFIGIQQKELNKYINHVTQQKANCINVPKPVLGTKISIENLNHYYIQYLLNTQTIWNKLLSFIPGTHGFKSRILWAHSATNAYRLFYRLQESIHFVENVAGININEQYRLSLNKSLHSNRI